MPYTTTVEIVRFLESVVGKIFNEVKQVLQSHIVTVTNIQMVVLKVSLLIENMNRAMTIFKPFSLEYLIQKQYKDHPQFVSPKTVSIGQSLDIKNVAEPSASKCKTAQYVSITETLKSCFKNKRFFELIMESQRATGSDGIYARYQDGLKFKKLEANHAATGKYAGDKVIIVHIQLYTNGLGITNPLSVAASRNSSTVLYFIVLNLHPKYYACLSNIYLVACCYTADIEDQIGQEALMQIIVDELRDLEDIGFLIDIPGKENFRVFVNLGQFTADNLAVNQTFGLIESFSHDFYCALCYTKKEEAQTGNVDSFF